jgi:transcriptional regulator with XRE-family HTH domain
MSTYRRIGDLHTLSIDEVTRQAPPQREEATNMTTEPCDSFAHLLRQHRQARRLSQTRLSELLDVDHSYISRIEAGTRHPSLEMVQRMSGVLRLTGQDAHAFWAAAGYLHGDCVPVPVAQYLMLTDAFTKLSEAFHRLQRRT